MNSPNSAGAVSIECLVVSDHGEAFAQRLGADDPVERVTMVKWKFEQLVKVVRFDGKHRKMQTWPDPI